MGPRANSPLTRPHLRSSASIPASDRQLRTESLSSKRRQNLSDSDSLEHIKRRKRVKPPPKQLRIPLRSREPDIGLTKAELPRPVTGSLRKSRRHLPPIHTSLTNGTGDTHNVFDGGYKDQKEPEATSHPKNLSQPEKRSLRSHDGGSRSRTELSTYFHNYEQMISLEPAAPEFLIPTSNITLIDDLQPGYLQDAVTKSLNRPASIIPKLPTDATSQEGGSVIFTGWDQLYSVQRINLDEASQNPRRFTRDPLSSDLFIAAHRRPERQEKQLRNIEKERAQHEKVQLERLLGDLKGPDWLRVMGISGITETEKKMYEPKRVLFVKEVAGMIEKFKHWKEEEKRRKVESQQALFAEEEESEVDDSDGDQKSESTQSSFKRSQQPDTNDLDVLAANQLHEEAKSASKTSARRKVTNPQSNPPAPLPPPVPLSPIKSFYAKKHLRDAALGTNRRGGRILTAFGVPLPEMVDKEFELTDDILNEDSIRASARSRRRRRRDRPDG